MRRLFQLEDHVVKAEKAVVVGLIFALVGLSFMQVLLRILFHSGIVWLDPLLRHMVLWAGLTGAALATRYSHHFALEAFVKSAPAKLHRPLEIFADVFMVAASCLLFSASYKFIRDGFETGSVAFYIDRLGVPNRGAVMIIPIAFALIAYHALMGIFRPGDSPAEVQENVTEGHS